MATTPITAVTLTATGYNLTDSGDFTTMSTGAGNGVEFSFNANDFLVLKNTTGGSAVYTITVPNPATYSNKGVTVPDATVTVVTGKTWMYKLSAIFKQSDGDVIIECDVAADILVLSP
jgi:hypothetical protein